MKVEFDKYPTQKFLGDLKKFLHDNEPADFDVNLKWELVKDEEELQQGTAYVSVRN